MHAVLLMTAIWLRFDHISLYPLIFFFFFFFKELEYRGYGESSHAAERV